MNEKMVEPIEEEANEMHVGNDMQPLLDSLNDEQKKALYQLLEAELEGGEMDESSGADIAAGKPGMGEKKAIKQKMAQEPTEDTDEMMLQTGKVSIGKPRNLGERAMLAAQERMKSRGKG